MTTWVGGWQPASQPASQWGVMWLSACWPSQVVSISAGHFYLTHAISYIVLFLKASLTTVHKYPPPSNHQLQECCNLKLPISGCSKQQNWERNTLHRMRRHIKITYQIQLLILARNLLTPLALWPFCNTNNFHLADVLKRITHKKRFNIWVTLSYFGCALKLHLLGQQ